MKNPANKARFAAFAASLALTCFALRATATPYASGVSNSAGTVSFILNESADSVLVVTNSPDGITGTNDLGALAKGTHSFSLDTATNYSIVVYKNSAPGYRSPDGTTTTINSIVNRNSSIIEISDPASPLLLFNSPRGIAINRRADSPYFGRVYLSNSGNPAGGSTTNLLGVIRNNASADGIYLLNADGTDAVGQGDTARTGGLNWGTSSESPNRLFIGPDDMLYICDRGSASSAGLYMADPDLSATSGTNILVAFSGTTQFPVGDANTHGRIDCVNVSGSLATSNLRLYTQDADLQPNKTTSTATKRNSIWRSPSTDLLTYANIPYANNFDLTGDKFTSPQNHQNQTGVNYTAASDFEKGPNGYYYVLIPRDDGNTWWVFDGSFSGSGLFNARSAGDTALSGYCLGLSPDAKYVAMGTRLNGHVFVYPTDSGFVPVHARRVLLPIGPGGSSSAQREREVRFDAANNMYVLQENKGLRVFSPGGASVATTTGSTNSASGETFSVQFGPAINPQPVSATRNANQNATFTITADGTAPIYYQWFKNGSPLSDVGNITGSDAATLTLAAPLSCATDSGGYQVIVSNAVGVVTSVVATLTVVDPVIATQPISQTNGAGATVTFSVTAAGSPTLLYQWKRDATNLVDGLTGTGSTISGATTFALQIDNISQADAMATYQVVVTSTEGCATNVATSSSRSLVVADPPLFTVQPSDTVVTAGATTNLHAAATGGLPGFPLTWSWYNTNAGGTFLGNGTSVGAAAGSNYLAFAPAGLADRTAYYVVVNGYFAGTATSTNAYLSVNVPQPFIQPITIDNGTNLTATWDTIVGGVYELQYCTNLNGPVWITVSNFTADDVTITMFDYPNEGEPQRFYRVIAQ